MPKLPRRGFTWQGAQAWSSARPALLLVVAPSRVREESEQRGRQFECRVRPASQDEGQPASSDAGCPLCVAQGRRGTHSSQRRETSPWILDDREVSFFLIVFFISSTSHVNDQKGKRIGEPRAGDRSVLAGRLSTNCARARPPGSCSQGDAQGGRASMGAEGWRFDRSDYSAHHS